MCDFRCLRESKQKCKKNVHGQFNFRDPGFEIHPFGTPTPVLCSLHWVTLGPMQAQYVTVIGQSGKIDGPLAAGSGSNALGSGSEARRRRGRRDRGQGDAYGGNKGTGGWMKKGEVLFINKEHHS